jgi:hypothetical protein
MSIIDTLLPLVQPPPSITESLDDIEEVDCEYSPGRKCLRCKLCGSISGTSLKLFHLVGCPYQTKRTSYGPYILGKRIYGRNPINPELYEEILMDEYAIISSNSTKPIIGTHGAGPCIILCMRDRTNTNTILAHTTALTINPLGPFLSFSRENSDVYIIGGDSSSISDMNKILLGLKEYNYTVTFAHVIDQNANNFAINCITGETWIDTEVHYHQPTNDQKFKYTFRAFSSQPRNYYEVKIPFKPSGGKRRFRGRTRHSRRSRRRSSRRNSIYKQN